LKIKSVQSHDRFLALLFEKGRVGFIGSINDFFQKLADELKGVARASLVSATELSAETIEKIRTPCPKKTGKDIILEVRAGSGTDRRHRYPHRGSCSWMGALKHSYSI
jgi:F0F1-type ATP synthase delta subunit